MLQKLLIKSLVLGAILMLSPQSVASSEWSPVRVLGMVYPGLERAARIHGDIIAKCSIRPDGSVADVAIVSGDSCLARSVKLNLMMWTFRHSDIEKELDREFSVTFSFRLQGNCDEYNRCKEEYWFENPNHVTVISEMPRLQPDIVKVKK